MFGFLSEETKFDRVVSLPPVYMDRPIETDAETAMRIIRARFPKRLVLAAVVVVATPRDEIDPAPPRRSGEEMTALFESMKFRLCDDAALHDALTGPRK